MLPLVRQASAAERCQSYLLCWMWFQGAVALWGAAIRDSEPPTWISLRCSYPDFLTFVDHTRKKGKKWDWKTRKLAGFHGLGLFSTCVWIFQMSDKSTFVVHQKKYSRCCSWCRRCHLLTELSVVLSVDIPQSINVWMITALLVMLYCFTVFGKSLYLCRPW